MEPADSDVKEVKDILRLSTRFTKPLLKVAEQRAKAPGVSWTKLKLVPALEISLPMMAMKEDVLSAGMGFCMLEKLIVALLM